MANLKINKKFSLKDKFSDVAPWHYDATKKEPIPDLGNVKFDYESMCDWLIERCDWQPKDAKRGIGRYFTDGKVNLSMIQDKEKAFKKLFDVWMKSNWNLENSTYFEFYDEELGDFYQPLMEAYQDKFGEILNPQLRVFVMAPMQHLGLHFDTFGTYRDKHHIKGPIFRAMTFVSDWEWGHYSLVGNNVLHQYKAGDTVHIQQNVPHCGGNLGFNPKITMNITGILDESL